MSMRECVIQTEFQLRIFALVSSKPSPNPARISKRSVPPDPTGYLDSPEKRYAAMCHEWTEILLMSFWLLGTASSESAIISKKLAYFLYSWYRDTHASRTGQAFD